MKATDFSNSYMTWSVPHNPNDKRVPGHKPWGNSARILLDARCELINEKSDTSDEFFLIVPCRTEWMYQKENLFQIPSREYRGIWSRSRQMGLGKGVIYGGEQRKSSPTKNTFTSLDFTIHSFPSATALQTDEAVIEATQKGLPLVAQTEIWDEERKMRAIIEYPVKTMNFHPERNRFQVDTGPLPLPDFTSDAEEQIEWFSLAHVVYNTFDRAEFIIRQPTPVLKDGQEVCSVMHYSGIRVHEARNTILCAAQPPIERLADAIISEAMFKAQGEMAHIEARNIAEQRVLVQEALLEKIEKSPEMFERNDGSLCESKDRK